MCSRAQASQTCSSSDLHVLFIGSSQTKKTDCLECVMDYKNQILGRYLFSYNVWLNWSVKIQMKPTDVLEFFSGTNRRSSELLQFFTRSERLERKLSSNQLAQNFHSPFVVFFHFFVFISPLISYIKTKENKYTTN